MTWRTTIGCAALTLLLVAPAAAHHGWQHAPYDVPLAELEAAAECRSGGVTGGFDVLTGAGASEPVLLLHGAGVTREDVCPGRVAEHLTIPATAWPSCWRWTRSSRTARPTWRAQAPPAPSC